MKANHDRLRCAIADRRLLLVQLLSHVMSSHPRIVIEATAATRPDLDELLVRHDVDLLLVGARLLDIDGGDVIRRVREQRPSFRCIVLADGADRVRLRPAVAASVHAVVSMTQSFDVLKQAVESIPGSDHDGDEFVVARPTFPPGLTARQVEVLRLVGAGKTSREIAAILGISWRTVETHRKHIVARLRAKGGRLVRMATWQALAHEGRGPPDRL